MKPPPTAASQPQRDLPCPDAIEACRAALALHSKSFDLASRLFPREVRGHAAVLYAWCRRADDAIDDAPLAAQPAALARLQAELGLALRQEAPATDLTLRAFQQVVQLRGLPGHYPWELLAGMEMDCKGQRYPDLQSLLHYCYRVAGTVGLMMCHVMGIRDDDALQNAAHLGFAMQLTNICRDVQEDWDRGRLYLPEDMLAQEGFPGLRDHLGDPLPAPALPAVGRVIERLLQEADRYYASADQGMDALPPRCALAVRTARNVYAGIGGRLRARGTDRLSPRAFVSLPRKLGLVALSMFQSLGAAVRKRSTKEQHTPPLHTLPFGPGLMLRPG